MVHGGQDLPLVSKWVVNLSLISFLLTPRWSYSSLARFVDETALIFPEVARVTALSQVLRFSAPEVPNGLLSLQTETSRGTCAQVETDCKAHADEGGPSLIELLGCENEQRMFGEVREV